MTTRVKTLHVFINCPFDPGYQPIFNAIVFAVYALGFQVRCALEDDDSGEIRLVKIQRMIEECRFGINDLSTVTLDVATRRPHTHLHPVRHNSHHHVAERRESQPTGASSRPASRRLSLLRRR